MIDGCCRHFVMSTLCLPHCHVIASYITFSKLTETHHSQLKREHEFFILQFTAIFIYVQTD